jgi:DNA-binding NarL/FixJ family response regulator
MHTIRVLIADDHGDFRKVVHSFLDSLPNVTVVGEAVDGEDVIKKTEHLDPDLVLMDISMPHRNGLDAARIIKDRWPTKKVVITTMSEDPVYRMRAREVRADDFILKSSMKPELEAALRRWASDDAPTRSTHSGATNVTFTPISKHSPKGVPPCKP